MSVYEQVVEAYISGLEDLKQAGGDVSKIGSVASIFVSRIDSAVDKRLESSAIKSWRIGCAARRDRQRKTRLCSLQSAVLRPALAESGEGRGEDTTPALGLHKHEKSGLQRHDVCRSLDRPRHRGHHSAGDDGRFP